VAIPRLGCTQNSIGPSSRLYLEPQNCAHRAVHIYSHFTVQKRAVGHCVIQRRIDIPSWRRQLVRFERHTSPRHGTKWLERATPFYSGQQPSHHYLLRVENKRGEKMKGYHDKGMVKPNEDSIAQRWKEKKNPPSPNREKKGPVQSKRLLRPSKLILDMRRNLTQTCPRKRAPALDTP
jgi:hypothetical protein